MSSIGVAPAPGGSSRSGSGDDEEACSEEARACALCARASGGDPAGGSACRSTVSEPFRDTGADGGSLPPFCAAAQSAAPMLITFRRLPGSASLSGAPPACCCCCCCCCEEGGGGGGAYAAPPRASNGGSHTCSHIAAVQVSPQCTCRTTRSARPATGAGASLLFSLPEPRRPPRPRPQVNTCVHPPAAAPIAAEWKSPQATCVMRTPSAHSDSMRFGTELSTGAAAAARGADAFEGFCLAFALAGMAPALGPCPSLPSSAQPQVYTSPDAACRRGADTVSARGGSRPRR